MASRAPTSDLSLTRRRLVRIVALPFVIGLFLYVASLGVYAASSSGAALLALASLASLAIALLGAIRIFYLHLRDAKVAKAGLARVDEVFPTKPA
jgi:hypothetical protein